MWINGEGLPYIYIYIYIFTYDICICTCLYINIDIPVMAAEIKFLSSKPASALLTSVWSWRVALDQSRPRALDCWGVGSAFLFFRDGEFLLTSLLLPSFVASCTGPQVL